MKGIRLYFKYIRMNFLIGFQYKGWPVMCLLVLIAVITDPIGLILMFERFGSIGSWTVERIILVYAIAVTSFGLAESFNRGFDYFPTKMIQSGDFDRIMLRPRSIVCQIAGSYFHLHRLSRVFGGTFAIIWSLSRQGISMDAVRIIVLVFALLGGFLMYSGVFIFSSGIAFYTVKSLDWIYIFSNVSYTLTKCPADYIPRALKGVFTFIMPLLVVSYFPASYICGWGEGICTALLAFPSGLLFLGLSYLVWTIGVKHYKSTGS